MTDWEKQLGCRATSVERAKEALDTDIAAARLDGHSFREIGGWAGVNHERARTIAIRINGDSRTRDESEGPKAPLGEPRLVSATEALQRLREALPPTPSSEESSE
ncbi:hypothetical protein [Streptomyces antibioticus]|nr:hypothetical protein [Streptomyces antibioticus]QIT47620.1 hypothetical protein HCX60_32205 [Streptomyces antibioticus]